MTTVKVDTTKLDQLRATIKPKCSVALNTFGTAIAGDAARRAPVDTGALRSSITSESHMEGELRYVMQDGVNYGVHNEFGTSRMPAHPFFIPAVEAGFNKFVTIMMKVIS